MFADNANQVRRFVGFWETQQLSRAKETRIAASRFESRCGSQPASEAATFPSGPPETDRQYKKCKAASAVPGVPYGSFFEHKGWSESVVYPGTLRDFDVWTPPETSAEEELGVIVVADGKAAWRFATKIDTVLSNLIHQGKIPRVALVLCGVGYEPNTGAEAMPPRALFPQSVAGMIQRFRELDVVSDEFVRHIDSELLPFIEKKHSVKFTNNPKLRVMCGQSSGGIAAFSAAWHRPDRFGAVIGVSTSFCNSLPGYMMPQEVRLTSPKKPLRIYLNAGEHDVEMENGSWKEHTLLMGNALKFRGYEHICKVAKGGGHTLRYTGSNLDSILAWIFEPVMQKGKVVPTSSRHSRL